MIFQQTLKKPIEFKGIEPYGGSEVSVYIEPRKTPEGIGFVMPNGEIIAASLDNAVVKRSAICLEKYGQEVAHVEHMLATLYAYEIDNALVYLERTPSLKYDFLKKLGMATDVIVIPNAKGRESTLCELLNGNSVPQIFERNILTLDEKLVFQNGGEKFIIAQPGRSGLSITVHTKYPSVGEEHFECNINSENYLKELAAARSYVKHVPSWMPLKAASLIASCAYPRFGIGHGFSAEHFFFPQKSEKEWRKQEIYPAEIARHSIVDRLGALALLPGRLDGVSFTYMGIGHKQDLEFLRKNSYNFVEYTFEEVRD